MECMWAVRAKENESERKKSRTHRAKGLAAERRSTHSGRLYLNDAFDGFALTPPPFSLPLPTLALALALRIDKSTSLQYLSLSRSRCANFACSGSDDGGRSACAITWLSVQRVST